MPAPLPGAGDPSITAALTQASRETFGLIALPSYASALVTEFTTELAERWGPTQQIDGIGVMAYRGAAGTLAQATTYGGALNSEFLTVMDAGHYPNPGYEIAASVAGAAALSAENDPARPFTTLELKGLLAPKVQERRAFADREALLRDGMSTATVDSGGRVRIERLITTYQENASGVPDEAYLNVNTPLTLSHIRRDFRNYIQGKYGRHKLADDGTRIGPGQPVITQKIGRAEAVARFRTWETAGLVEGFEQFKADLVCQRNRNADNPNGNPDRLDWLVLAGPGEPVPVRRRQVRVHPLEKEKRHAQEQGRRNLPAHDRRRQLPHEGRVDVQHRHAASAPSSRGPDVIHGYSEEPMEARIEGAITDSDGLSLAQLQALERRDGDAGACERQVDRRRKCLVQRIRRRQDRRRRAGRDADRPDGERDHMTKDAKAKPGKAETPEERIARFIANECYEMDLSKPITVDGDKRQELQIRDPGAGVMEGMFATFGDGVKLDLGDMIKIVAEGSGIPLATARKISFKDMLRHTQPLMIFFGADTR